MREHITTGIRQAINTGLVNEIPALANITDAAAEILTEEILNALANQDVPTPTVTVAPEATALSISPAAVVARMARQGLESALLRGENSEDFAIVYTYGDSPREVRDYLFAVQRMFGVKVRSQTQDGEQWFVIAGHNEQVTAIIDSMEAMTEFAAPILDDLDTTEDQMQFWATLGASIAESDAGQERIRHNEVYYRDATNLMDRAHGRARTLARTPVATEGRIAEFVNTMVANQN